MSHFPKLTDRIEEAHNPANNLALAMAFSSVGLISTLMPMMLAALYFLR